MRKPVSEGFYYIVEVTHWDKATILEYLDLIKSEVVPARKTNTVKAYCIHFKDDVVVSRTEIDDSD